MTYLAWLVRRRARGDPDLPWRDGLRLYLAEVARGRR